MLSAFAEGLELSELYQSYGRIKSGQVSLRWMFKIIVYAAMSRIYSSRDINFMHLLEGKQWVITEESMKREYGEAGSKK